ncbi:MAG: hypothetical protein KBS91_04080 [Firmicutes bacterium]|nr:hypothetical protein [Candidatus Caballimonas caccae]
MGNIAKTSAKAMATAVGAVSAGLVAVGKAFADGITDVAAYGDNIDKMS